MAALGSGALREQLSVIMGALTAAAVAEICDVLDEGYAVLRMEIRRSHLENEALKKKLHLIQSIVVRGGAEGDGRGGVMGPAELPDVVLIKDEDEDEDSNEAFEEDDQTAAEGEGARRRWPEADRKSPCGPPAEKKTVYSLASPRGEMEAGSYSSLGEPDCPLAHRGSGRPPYFSGGSLTECPTDGEPNLSLAKGHAGFPHFPHSEDPGADAFGLKMISVTGSAFEYEDGDPLSLAHYRDPVGGAQLCGARGRRYVCPVCSKTYATSQNLEVHMRIHTGERPFCCSQCGKKFTQSAHLKSHLSVHSGERPHTCALCCRSFIVKYSLKLHMRKCHDRVLPD
ncbi:uncharacterized protein AB9W97_021627 [Spinachia spinachia]